MTMSEPLIPGHAADESRVAASFRDPNGFMFTRGGALYRQVNVSYREHYEQLLASGLYENLASAGLLIPHEEVDLEPEAPELAFKILRPERVPFISYPYEWSFSQLKDAALTTLRIQKRALARGLTLKDASAYNLQFREGRPVLIDTLSFEVYREGEPWVAYRQFCQHFLAPLALMAYCDVRLGQLLRVYIDGIPLDLASRLLPFRTRLNFSLLTHLHLHAAAQQRYSGKTIAKADASRQMNKVAFQGLIDSLQSAVRKLAWKPSGTEWGAYYSDTNYTDQAQEHKQQVVADFLRRTQPESVWDLGANTGLFSRLASDQGLSTLAFDIDPAAVELNYLSSKEKKEKEILPLLLDLTNPSPAIGWQNRERQSLVERGPAGAVLALAVIHHLAISNNVPLGQVAAFLHSLTRRLIVEFVPKSDSQVQRLLATRLDIFPEYTKEGFERAFRPYFQIEDTIPVRDSERCLYLMIAM
jgi:ribosomal protein L11 methylase PrmA